MDYRLFTDEQYEYFKHLVKTKALRYHIKEVKRFKWLLSNEFGTITSHDSLVFVALPAFVIAMFYVKFKNPQIFDDIEILLYREFYKMKLSSLYVYNNNLSEDENKKAFINAVKVKLITIADALLTK